MTNPNENKKNTCHYDFLRFERCKFTAHKWKLSNSLGFMGPSWSDFSLASVLFGLYECVCNNSLKLYHGEISRLCYIAGHYRTITCITSSALISQNGGWGAQQESLCINSVTVDVQVWGGCILVWRLYFCTTLPALAAVSLAWAVARVWACTCVSACAVGGHVCMHVEWHLGKCGSSRRNIWLIIEVPWRKYDRESERAWCALP